MCHVQMDIPNAYQVSLIGNFDGSQTLKLFHKDALLFSPGPRMKAANTTTPAQSQGCSDRYTT